MNSLRIHGPEELPFPVHEPGSGGGLHTLLEGALDPIAHPLDAGGVRNPTKDIILVNRALNGNDLPNPLGYLVRGGFVEVVAAASNSEVDHDVIVNLDGLL